MGSILSRLDPKLVTKDNKTLSVEVLARNERQSAPTVTAEEPGGEGGAVLSLSKRSAVEKVSRRTSDSIR